jgi:hypothetical protein
VRLYALFLSLAFAFVAMAVPSRADAQLYVSVIAPPALQISVQPQLSNPNYIWTPGFWAYGSGGYYWVAGNWVQAPRAGLLWTPGYWAWSQNRYAFNQGYWGASVGFYGGINYGFGYFGNGYSGGRWEGSAFRYNTAVSRVDTTVIRNVYVDKSVTINGNGNRVSYNGGTGGVRSSPDAAQTAAAHQEHVAATDAQRQRTVAAASDRSNFATPTKPAAKPAEKPAAKPAAKPAEKPAAKPAEKPAEKPAAKPAEKPAEKPDTKPSDKPPA